jgi:hypothetical protein
MGKSRLAREVSGWATEHHVRTVSGRAVPASASTAYRPLTGARLQLLRSEPFPDDPGLASWLPALDPVIPRRHGTVIVGPPWRVALGID